MRNFITNIVISTLVVLALTVSSTQSALAQTFKVIYSFTGQADGGGPFAGVTLDKAGNLYGTTSGAVSGYGSGGVYKLKRVGSGWIASPLYSFSGGSDGGTPYGRVTFGPDGSLYGTTIEGGSSGGSCQQTHGCGVVFNLRPLAVACKTAICPWTETVLYTFTGGVDGANPNRVDPVFDQQGNVYGTTTNGGSSGCNCGVVFKVSHSGGGWTESIVHSFNGDDGNSPWSGVIFDTLGNLYGMTKYGYGYGSVYELAPSGSGWTINNLYIFQGQSDGNNPTGGLTFDQYGNLYGATTGGGDGGGGTVFEVLPSGGNWTFSTLYGLRGSNYTGPEGNVVVDAAGNVYGADSYYGAYGCGSIFKLTPSNGSWTYTSLQDFTGGDDGLLPLGGLTIDASGNIYGTAGGGGVYGWGTVWEITP